jgi:putative membrane protein
MFEELLFLNGYHMMDWWGDGWVMDHSLWFLPFRGMGMLSAWLIVTLAIAYLVYKDAESRGMNGLLWALPVLFPWVGLLFLLGYLIVREVKASKGARAILEERYARGEIIREEYQRIRDDLKEK